MYLLLQLNFISIYPAINAYYITNSNAAFKLRLILKLQIKLNNNYVVPIFFYALKFFTLFFTATFLDDFKKLNKKRNLLKHLINYGEIVKLV